MKVLIIGVSGFIGSAMIKYLCEKNVIIYGCGLGYCENLNIHRYIQFNDSQSFFKELFEPDYDVCINCAGAASVPDSFVNPINDYELNCSLVASLLDGIKRYSPNCRFLTLSSAAVYGDPKLVPIVERAILDPISPYGFHKMISEQLCKEYHRVYGIDTRVLRPFSVYGPGLKKQLFWDLYNKVTRSKTVELFGTGLESRDFIFIDDFVRAVWSVALDDSLVGQIVNVGNGEELHIKDVAEIFLSEFGSDVSLSFSGDARTGDPSRWCADISTLKSIGYVPNVSISDGLKMYADWVKRIAE